MCRQAPGPYNSNNTLLTLKTLLVMADMDGILSQEEMEDMGLEPEQVKVLKGCFDGFADEDGAIPADNVGGILSMMGMKVKPSALKEIIEEIDEDGSLNCNICHFAYLLTLSIYRIWSS